MSSADILLSDLVSFRTYRKALPHLGRKETLEETINRNMQMHLDKFPALTDYIVKAFGAVHAMKVMPSMRGMQYAGQAISKNNIRQYNCSYTPVDRVRAFGEIPYLLLAGSGVGFSVQKRHIRNLPKVVQPTQSQVFVIPDSIEGWAEAFQALADAYLNRAPKPIFDFSQIRPKGAWLHTTGARAPGPEPLRRALDQLDIIYRSIPNRQLSSLEVHDIVCITSDCVVSGGVRRAALISLFDRDDNAMLTCKSGNWFNKHSYRARANNSAVMLRGEVSKIEFSEIFDACRDSGSGEPGIGWFNDPDVGVNPCFEASLRKNTFCNLTTSNQTGANTKDEFLYRVEQAAFIGTLQAAYTDFPFLDHSWKINTEEDALLGVSFTGVADSNIPVEWLSEGAKVVLSTNEKFARMLGINVAARTTVVKPEGSSSLLLGSSSGMRSRDGKFYLRRIQINNNDSLLEYLNTVVPDLIEPAFGVQDTSVITIPQMSPDGALLAEEETALSAFKRAVDYNKYWVQPGHRRGANYHNVSCTLNLEDNEWDSLKEAMWSERNNYSGMSMYPKDNGTYVQAPFEICTEATYRKLSALIKPVNLSEVSIDNVGEITQVSACSGTSCEITSFR